MGLKTWMMTVGAAGVLTAGSASAQLQGSVAYDGSSTVSPITAAVQEAFKEAYPGVTVSGNESGTGGGFKRFATGETDISNASRPIKSSEAEAAASNGVEFIEVPVAYDGLSIVVNKSNTWASEVTVDELKKIFLDTSEKPRTWQDVRPEWPATPIVMFIPGTDSGTFDYFKEVVAGKDGNIRSDVSVSENDNVLVTGVAGNPGGIGFFGASYYFENQDKLKSLAIQNEAGDFVKPQPDTIESGEYSPFSRPLFIYVNKKSLSDPAVKAFVDFYMEVGPDLAEEVGYVRLPDSVYAAAEKNLAEGKTGSMMHDAESVVEAFK